MGYDISLITGHVDEELFCPICADVLEDPLQSSACEHAFCRTCIEKWMNEKQICPVDRSVLLPDHLVSVSRLMRNMLSRLKIKCSFAENGCRTVMRLDEFRTHVESCRSNPKVAVMCNQGCGMMVPKDELSNHNCVSSLRDMVKGQSNEIAELRVLHAQHETRLADHRRELELVQYYIAALRSTNPEIRNVGEHLDHYSLMRWGRTLPFARVRNWGSLISTPDTSMHMMVRDGLRGSRCPMHMINVLLNCCYEESWPQGLTTLELRRVNHHRLNQFLIRVLPLSLTEKPCVVALSGDNGHMPGNLRPSLGIIMVFLGGVDDSEEPLGEEM